LRIAGYAKTSFVDYPGEIACVVFTAGCNMRCAYCHNKHILAGDIPLKSQKELFAYLTKRRDVLQAVVVTGGEPTLQDGLADFLRSVKELGYHTKLDTNGTNPLTLKALAEGGLLDYIAMDVKAPLYKYGETAGVPVNLNAITASIDFIKHSGIAYEFRTTFAPSLGTEDVCAIGGLVKGARAYYLQQYRQVSGQPPPHDAATILEAACKLRALAGVCEVRGL